MNLPLLAAIALGATMLTSKNPAKAVVRQSQKGMTPGGHALTRPTGPSQMWVDRPENTVLRNDAKGRTPVQIDRYLRQTYATEAAMHPGVRLVAGTATA